MALTFPLSLHTFADGILPGGWIESVAWNLMRQDEYSGLGTGEFLTHDLGPPLWEAEVSSIEMYNDDARRLKARFNALDGSNSAFFLYDPTAAYPASDPTGATYGSSTPLIDTINANRKAIKISGLPANYVLTEGDLFEVDYDSSPYRRSLLQVVEAATADGAGLTPEFEVRPHLRPAITTTLEVNFIKPSAKVKLVPDTLRSETVGPMTSRLRFTARQTLQSG